MKIWALLSSNLPSVIHRSNLSPSREAFHFYFYSNNDLTSPKGPRKQNRFSELRFSGKKTVIQPVEWKSVAWLTALRTCREIMPSSCPLT